MENLLIALKCVFPIFVYLMVGCLAKRGHFIPDAAYPQINRLCFYVLIPCSLFTSIYRSDAAGLMDLRFVVTTELLILGSFLLGTWYCRRFVPDLRRRGVMTQVFFRPNVGVIGIAMIQSIYPGKGTAAMALYLALAVPVFNGLAVYTLERCRGGSVAPLTLAKNILKNPFVLGCLAGIAAKLSGLSVPELILSPVETVGKAGSTMAVVVLGATFSLKGLREDLPEVLKGLFIRLVLVPVLGLIPVALCGFRQELLAVFILALGGPLASGTYAMAQVYDSDHKLAGEIVVTSSLLCCGTIFLWIFLAGQFGLM